ncbi:MAG: hypothetical protein HY906_10575 [Deltaproteobacteria bacterium]|nr:hypothetical protein [Deltaproteobacteria bacterium]
MSCPFIRVVEACYCSAFPIRKLIPRSELHQLGPCQEGHESCSVFRSSATQRIETIFTEAGARGQIEVRLRDERPPCVWMSEEVISFRLCDRDFECADCPVEAALTGAARALVESPEARRLALGGSAARRARRCKYVLVADARRRTCDRDYRCPECETFLQIQGAVAGRLDPAKRSDT